MTSSEVDIRYDVLFDVGNQHSTSSRCNPRGVIEFNTSSHYFGVVSQVKICEISSISTSDILSIERRRRRLAERDCSNSDYNERFFEHFKLIYNLILESFMT